MASDGEFSAEGSRSPPTSPSINSHLPPSSSEQRKAAEKVGFDSARTGWASARERLREGGFGDLRRVTSIDDHLDDIVADKTGGETAEDNVDEYEERPQRRCLRDGC